MVININPHWRIVSDEHCYTLQKLVTNQAKDKKPRWISKTYHATLEQAIDHYAELFLRNSPESFDSTGCASSAMAEALDYARNTRAMILNELQLKADEAY